MTTLKVACLLLGLAAQAAADPAAPGTPAGRPGDAKAKPAARRLVDHTLAWGWSPTTGQLYERGSSRPTGCAARRREDDEMRRPAKKG